MGILLTLLISLVGGALLWGLLEHYAINVAEANDRRRFLNTRQEGALWLPRGTVQLYRAETDGYLTDDEIAHAAWNTITPIERQILVFLSRDWEPFKCDDDSGWEVAAEGRDALRLINPDDATRRAGIVIDSHDDLNRFLAAVKRQGVKLEDYEV